MPAEPAMEMPQLPLSPKRRPTRGTPTGLTRGSPAGTTASHASPWLDFAPTPELNWSQIPSTPTPWHNAAYPVPSFNQPVPWGPPAPAAAPPPMMAQMYALHAYAGYPPPVEMPPMALTPGQPLPIPMRQPVAARPRLRTESIPEEAEYGEDKRKPRRQQVPLSAALTTTMQQIRPAPGQSVAKAQPRRVRGAKNTCRFLVPDVIAADTDFRAAKALIGRGGQNLRVIADATNAKIRVRGRGSGHLEGPEFVESTDPLMCCLSCPVVEDYDEAKKRVGKVFEQMFDMYVKHCKKLGRHAPELQMIIQE